MKLLISAWLVTNPFFFVLLGALFNFGFLTAMALKEFSMELGYLAVSTKNYIIRPLVSISVIDYPFSASPFSEFSYSDSML